MQPDLTDTENDFIEPEQVRLYRELGFDVHYIDGLIIDVTPTEDIAETSHQRRFAIGERLSNIGDLRQGVGLKDGLPDILWLPVMGSPGEFEFCDDEGEVYGTFEVQPFFIAKYLTTFMQFQAFIDSSEYDDLRWWNGFPEDYQPQQPQNVTNGNANAPRDTVSWYQCVAFTRWLDAKYRETGKLAQFVAELPFALREKGLGDEGKWQIRLPTEWEWQWAAMHGTEARKYPWGEWDKYPRANTTEAGIQDRSTAVGMYPHGAAVCGALDMSGNLWEWCLNDLKNPKVVAGFGSGENKVLRGGSFQYNQFSAAASSRDFRPFKGYSDDGFRVVVGSTPI